MSWGAQLTANLSMEQNHGTRGYIPYVLKGSFHRTQKKVKTHGFSGDQIIKTYNQFTKKIAMQTSQTHLLSVEKRPQ